MTTMMIRLEVKNCNMTLTEKQKKYQHYHQERYISPELSQKIIDDLRLKKENQRKKIKGRTLLMI